MLLNNDSVMFLLGAGASCEAGIPISYKMIQKIEILLNEKEDWKPYQKLYNYLKNSIVHGFGIIGKFDENLINIEILVNTYGRIIKKL